MVFAAVVMFVVSNVIHFSYGAWLLDHHTKLTTVWRSPSILATIAGLAVGFLGISTLAHHMKPVVDEGGQTVLAQMATGIFGGQNFFFYGLQFATFAILVMAANTAYADFPRLSSLIARDGYLPRQLANRGDRLVFSNGILALSAMAAILIIVFKAEVSALIPLYAVGVFTGFSLSQFGMIRHHLTLREEHWKRGLVINAVGCFATTVVLLVVVPVVVLAARYSSSRSAETWKTLSWTISLSAAKLSPSGGCDSAKRLLACLPFSTEIPAILTRSPRRKL